MFNVCLAITCEKCFDSDFVSFIYFEKTQFPGKKNPYMLNLSVCVFV